MSWNWSCCPAAIPAPHCVGPVPALWQVDTPFGMTFQPCAFSSETAADGEYGYGPPDFSSGDAQFGNASTGTGPLAGSAYPPYTFDTICGRSIRSSMACRTYSCRNTAPTWALYKFGSMPDTPGVAT